VLTHFESCSALDRISIESHVASFFSWEGRGAMERDDNGQRNCPACGSEMMPPKQAFPGAKGPPTFSCHGCGVTSFGDHSPKLIRR
jgi:hypothetical protein